MLGPKGQNSARRSSYKEATSYSTSAWGSCPTVNMKTSQEALGSSYACATYKVNCFLAPSSWWGGERIFALEGGTANAVHGSWLPGLKGKGCKS